MRLFLGGTLRCGLLLGFASRLFVGGTPCFCFACGLFLGGALGCRLLLGFADGVLFGGTLCRRLFVGCPLSRCLFVGGALYCRLRLCLAPRLHLGGAPCGRLRLGPPLFLGGALGPRLRFLGVDRVALGKCLALLGQAHRCRAAVPTLPEHLRMVRPGP